MDDCKQGKRNENNIDKLFTLLEQRNGEVKELTVAQARTEEKVDGVSADVKELKHMIMNDQVDRNRKREQVETNKNKLDSLEDNHKKQDKWNFAVALLVIGALLKEVFFNGG